MPVIEIENEAVPSDSEEKETAESDIKELAASEVVAEVVQPTVASIKSSASQKLYYVYANINIPQEEDFTFLLTALWHWEQKYPVHTSKHVELSKILAKIPVKKESAKKPEAPIVAKVASPEAVSK